MAKVNGMDNFHKDLMSLWGVKPEDTKQAYYRDRAGEKHLITITAIDGYNTWDGYWDNFRLADYVGRNYPAAVTCAYCL